MKKYVFHALALLMVWQVCFVHPASAQRISYDRIVPEEMVLYRSYDSTVGNVQKFPNFDKAIEMWMETLDDFMEWRLISGEWKAIQEESGLDQSFSALMGDSYAMALSGFGESGHLPALLYLSYVPEPKDAEAVLKSVLDSVAKYDSVIQTEIDEYRGHVIGSIYGPGMVPGLGLSYSLDDDLLLICTSKPMLVEILESMDLDNGTLADDDTYKAAMAKLPPDRHTTVFLNTQEITASLENVLNMVKAFVQIGGNKDQDTEQALTIAETVLQYCKEIDFYAASVRTLPGDVQDSSSYTQFNGIAGDSPVQVLFSKDAKKMDFESYLPRNTGTYQSGNICSLNDIWTIVKAVAALIPDLNEGLNDFHKMEQDMGFSLEDDLLSWMGDEWCIVRPVMDLDAVVPTNKAAIMIQVKDADKARAGMEKLQHLLKDKLQLPVTPDVKVYRNAEIQSYRLPIPVIPIAPSWTITDDIFILSVHDSLIREMIDVKSGAARGIERNSYYRQMKPYLQEPSNWMSFQDTEAEFYTYRESMKRFTSVWEMGEDFVPEDQLMPFYLMDRGSYLLSCFQVLKAVAKTSLLTPNSVKSSQYILQRDLRGVPSLQYMNRKKVSLGGEYGTQKWIAMAADWLAENGDKERALRFYSILSEYYPDNGEYLLRAAKLAEEAGEADEATDLLMKAMNTDNPTALLISMEKNQHHENVGDIVAWVDDQLGEQDNARKDLVWLGLGFRYWSEGNSSIAEELFDKAQSDSSDDLVRSTASDAAMYLKSGEVRDPVSIPVIDQFPTIDGSDDDAVWVDGDDRSRTIDSEFKGFELKICRSGAMIYMLLEGETTDAIKEGDVTVDWCPSRNMKDLVTFHAKFDVDNDEVNIKTHLNQRKIDPFGFQLGDTNVSESLSTDWPVSAKVDGHRCTVEMALPIGVIRDKSPSPKDIWMFNIKQIVETESGPVNTYWLLDGDEDGYKDAPVRFLNAVMN